MDFDDEYEVSSEDLENLDELDRLKVERLIQEYNLELTFYRTIANTNEFEIIPYPDENGVYLNSKDLKLLMLNYIRENKKPLLRISHGKFATVYDKDTQKVGIMPEHSADGFNC